jgi:formylmethanofuran dehydrogenase subunit E
MNANEIMKGEEFQRCAQFHGHVCPGLSVGFRAAKVAMERLKETRAEDEEIVAIVETDACSADAVQVLTGCTFGKGNFIYKDYGKMALTLLSRKTGDGVRVAMRQGPATPNKDHFELLQKVMRGDASQEEKERFQALHSQRSRDILEMPTDRLFSVEKVKVELPVKARIEPSEPCDRCGEPTMRSKLLDKEGQRVCRRCMEIAHHSQ